MAAFRLALISLAATAVLWPAQGRADWQYTRWGMTPQQVVQASGGHARIVPSDPHQALGRMKRLVLAPYQAAGFNFMAAFYFVPEGYLAEVTVQLTIPSNCHGLLDELMGIYGKPERRTGIPNILRQIDWRDEKNRNLINYTEVARDVSGAPGSCRVAYVPMREPGKGL